MSVQYSEEFMELVSRFGYTNAEEFFKVPIPQYNSFISPYLTKNEKDQIRDFRRSQQNRLVKTI